MKIQIVVYLWLLMSSVYADSAQDIQIDQPFARAAIMQQRNSAVFMGITNSGESTQIVYAKSPVAKFVELHTHINDNGVMRMRKIKNIQLPSGQGVKLKPGGLHIMLLGLKKDLIIDDQVEVTLGFSDGSEKQMQVPVKKMNAQRHGGKMQDGNPMMMTH